MGQTTLHAVLDDNIIRCSYLREILPTESMTAVDLQVIVSHEYVTESDTVNSVVLEQFTIPKKFLKTKGLSHYSKVEQETSFTICNLRYLSNLTITVNETRDTLQITSEANVLDGSDPYISDLSSNPQKDIENDENQPIHMPDRNIVVPEIPSHTVYTYAKDGLDTLQTSCRIILDKGTFIEQDYNERIQNKVYIENANINLLSNPRFTSSDETLPIGWSYDASSLISNSHIATSEIPDVNIWMLRLTNTNLFNAFNSATIASDKADILPGISDITFSMYYRVKSTSNVIPFSEINSRIKFYLDDAEISTIEYTKPVGQLQNTWLDMVTDSYPVPASANKYILEFDVSDINTTDLFSVEFILPQVEPTPFSTTKSVKPKVEDKYITTKEIQISCPLFISVKTYNVTNCGLRGLFSSTTGLLDGIEFHATNNSLYLKVYDSTGLVSNTASSAFIPSSDIIEYGVWLDGSVIEFYVNKNLISSHAQTVTIDQSKICTVGCLERTNSSMNSELLNFKMFTYIPY